MVAAAASPASRFGRILGREPLRWLGVRSYGIYLWHFPIIVLTTPAAGGDTPSRRVLQLAAITRMRGTVVALHRGTDPPRRLVAVVGPATT